MQPLRSNVLVYRSGMFPSVLLCDGQRSEYVHSYLIIVKSLMPSVVAALYHDLTDADTNPPEWALSGHVWISLLMLILVPLSFLRKLDSLRHTSYIALFSVGEYIPIHSVAVC